jgi:GT2 family glycosyltransferase
LKSIQPLVSIITVNFNQPKFTIEFLLSLRNISYKEIEIIVVDNGSREDPSLILQKQFPEIIMIRSQQNLGFAGGNNIGIRRAKGKYILFMNNDTEVDPGFLEPMVDRLEKDTRIGMASPKILYPDNNILQYAGSTNINPYTGRGKRNGDMEEDKGQYNTTTETGLCHGAAMIVPMEVIKKVGLMPEVFFLYYEELDWCEMIKRSGYKLFYIAESKVYHKESMTVGKSNPMKTYYMGRNRILFTRRNVKGLKFFISILFFIFFTIPKNSLYFVIKGEFRHLKAYFKGILWNIFNFDVHKNIKYPTSV